MTRTRAQRRFYREKAIAKAKRIYSQNWSYYYRFSKPDEHLRAVRSADNMALCSCWKCGNPRKYFKGREKVTVQELKQYEKELTYENDL